MADNHIKFPTPENNENNPENAGESIFPDLGNDELIAAMEEINKSETKETQTALIERVLQARFFAPVDVIDANGDPLEGNGKIAIPKDAKFNFKLIQNQKGEQFFTLFTDIPEFQKWNKGTRVNTIVVVFPQIAQLVMQKKEEIKGFVINPMTQNIIFNTEVIENILNAMKAVSQNQAENGGDAEKRTVTLMFGKAKNVPDSVLGALKKKLAKHPEVNEAYFCMVKQNEQESYLFVLDINADNETCKDIGTSVCNAAKMFLTKYPIMAAPLNSPFGEGAKKVEEPFYVKEN